MTKFWRKKLYMLHYLLSVSCARRKIGYNLS